MRRWEETFQGPGKAISRLPGFPGSGHPREGGPAASSSAEGECRTWRQIASACRLAADGAARQVQASCACSWTHSHPESPRWRPENDVVSVADRCVRRVSYIFACVLSGLIGCTALPSVKRRRQPTFFKEHLFGFSLLSLVCPQQDRSCARCRLCSPPFLCSILVPETEALHGAALRHLCCCLHPALLQRPSCEDCSRFDVPGYLPVNRHETCPILVDVPTYVAGKRSHDGAMVRRGRMYLRITTSPIGLECDRHSGAFVFTRLSWKRDRRSYFCYSI